MAYRRRRGRGASNSRVVMGALGGLVALALSLYVFDQILDVVMPYINSTNSVYFSTVHTFVTAILPVIGIVAAYIVIKGAIKRMTF